LQKLFPDLIEKQGLPKQVAMLLVEDLASAFGQKTICSRFDNPQFGRQISKESEQPALEPVSHLENKRCLMAVVKGSSKLLQGCHCACNALQGVPQALYAQTNAQSRWYVLRTCWQTCKV